MQEALRTYLELAMGLTETSRKKVRKVVKEAVGRGNATADQVKALTSDLMAANSANREALAKLVRSRSTARWAWSGWPRPTRSPS